MEDRKIQIAKAAGVYAERHGITQLQALDLFEEVIDLLSAQQSVQRTGLTAGQFSEFMKNYVIDIMAQARKTPRR